MQIVGFEGGFGDDFGGKRLHEVKLLLDLAVSVVEQFLANRCDGFVIVLVCLARHLSHCALADALVILRVKWPILVLFAGVGEGIVGDLHGQVEENGLRRDVLAERVVVMMRVSRVFVEEIVEVRLIIHPLSII